MFFIWKDYYSLWVIEKNIIIPDHENCDFTILCEKITGYTRQLQDWIAGAIDIGVDMI